MNFFKGKMALKMGGWVGVYFALHKEEMMLLKLVHNSFFGRPYCKGSWQILLSTVCFSREISLRCAAWPGHSGFVGIQKNDLTTGPNSIGKDLPFGWNFAKYDFMKPPVSRVPVTVKQGDQQTFRSSPWKTQAFTKFQVADCEQFTKKQTAYATAPQKTYKKVGTPKRSC